MTKTLYLSKKDVERLDIDLSDYPSAGPRPNVSGMKKLVWGIDALVVKSGAYIYKVPADVYGRLY